MMDRSDVLAELQPHTRDIVSLVRRRPGADQAPLYPDDLNRHAQHMGYLSVVDGEQYVVSVTDTLMPKADIVPAVHDVMLTDIYAEPSRDQKWMKRSHIGLRIATFGRRFFEGHVLVASRDAHDASEYPGMNNGMIAYTLRRGDTAILYETGNMPDDPEFFMRAVRAVSPGNRIDRVTNLTALEEDLLEEMHAPVLSRLNQLIDRDGLPANQAYDRWQASITTPQIYTHCLTAATNTRYSDRTSTMAFYDLGPNGQLLLERQDGPDIGRTQITHGSFDAEGAPVVRTVGSRRDNPSILMEFPPAGDHHAIHYDAKRILTLDEADTGQLDGLLAAALENG